MRGRKSAINSSASPISRSIPIRQPGKTGFQSHDHAEGHLGEGSEEVGQASCLTGRRASRLRNRYMPGRMARLPLRLEACARAHDPCARALSLSREFRAGDTGSGRQLLPVTARRVGCTKAPTLTPSCTRMVFSVASIVAASKFSNAAKASRTQEAAVCSPERNASRRPPGCSRSRR